MIHRDWLQVTNWWTIYGVIEPVSGFVVYVGITGGDVEDRIKQHRCDRSSAIWSMIRETEAAGHQIKHCILGVARTEGAARHLEDALITVLPQIYNRTLWREGVGFWKPYANTPWGRGEDLH